MMPEAHKEFAHQIINSHSWSKRKVEKNFTFKVSKFQTLSWIQFLLTFLVLLLLFIFVVVLGFLE